MLKLPQTATVHEPYAWIWDGDDAIDRTGEDWESEYAAALESGDMERMPLRQGVKPTVFTLRHPTPTMRRYFAGFSSQDGMWIIGLRRVVALSIVSIENAGIPLDLKSTDPTTGTACIPDATMDLLEEVEKGALVNAIAQHILHLVNSPN